MKDQYIVLVNEDTTIHSVYLPIYIEMDGWDDPIVDTAIYDSKNEAIAEINRMFPDKEYEIYKLIKTNRM